MKQEDIGLLEKLGTRLPPELYKQIRALIAERDALIELLRDCREVNINR